MISNEHIILVTSYCNTKEKLEILEECLLHLKSKYSEFDIMIYAHYPLPFEIQNMVKYYIYDSTNPVIPEEIKLVKTWNLVTDVLKYPSKATNILPDTGFAVLSIWENALKYLDSRGYKYVHIIDYDLDVFGNEYDTLFRDNVNKLSGNIEAVFSQYIDNYHIDLTNASVNIKSYLNKISDLINIDEYLLDIHTGIEYYLGNIIQKSNIIHEIKSIKIFSFCAGQGIYKKKLNNLFFWCGKENDKIIFIVIDISNNYIKSIKLKVNDDGEECKVIQENNSYAVIDLTLLCPKYLKILEYNGLELNYILISKIDDYYLQHHYIEKI